MSNGTYTPADPAVIAALQGIQAAQEAIEAAIQAIQAGQGQIIAAQQQIATAQQQIATAQQTMVANTGVRPPTDAATLTQTFNTEAQGWLATRWQRRDGTVYPAPSTFARRNSPVRGGDDAVVAGKRVDVPSGAPVDPAGDLRSSVSRRD